MRKIVAMVMFLGSALFHGLALQWPGIGLPEHPVTHVLFVLVNAWLAMEVMASQYPSHRLFLMLGTLTIHQVIVHGYLFLRALDAETLDFQSLGVLMGLAIVWGLLNPKDS